MSSLLRQEIEFYLDPSINVALIDSVIAPVIFNSISDLLTELESLGVTGDLLFNDDSPEVSPEGIRMGLMNLASPYAFLIFFEADITTDETHSGFHSEDELNPVLSAFSVAMMKFLTKQEVPFETRSLRSRWLSHNHSND